MARRRPSDVQLVTQYYPPERGAAQVRLGAVVAELVRRGLAVEVVTSLPNYPTGRIFDGWSHRPLQVDTENGARLRRVWTYAAMGSGVKRMLNYASFGAMSVPGVLSARRARWTVVEYPTLLGAFPTVALARLRRRRVIVLVADLWVDSIVEVGVLGDGVALSLLRRLERWMLRSADSVTAVTEGVSDALVAKGVDPQRLSWLPNGADTHLFRPGPPDPAVQARMGLESGEKLFLYAGTHGYVHGLDVVLDAAEQLRGEPIRFVLVGAGSEKSDLVERARRMDLPNVTFLDPVSPEEVADMLRCATGALATVRAGDVYRSIRSAKSLPAMASGCPVIYSADDEGAALVASIGAGIVTAPGDGEQLADAVRAIASDPDLADEFGAAGRRWVKGNASWELLVGNWLDELGISARAEDPFRGAEAVADGNTARSARW